MDIFEFEKISYSNIDYAGDKIDIIRVNSFDTKEGWTVNFHKHIFFEFHYVLEGSTYTKFRDNEIEIKQGYFYVMRPDIIHAHYQKHGTSHKAFSMAWGMTASAGSKGLAEMFKNISPELKKDDGSIRRELDNFVNEYYDNQPVELLKLDFCRLLYAVASSFGKIQSYGNKNNIEKNIIEETLLFMNDNIERDLKAYDIASAIHISYPHLARLFSKILNSSVKKTYNDMKIEKAKDLLKQTSLTVEQIAIQSGFNNSNYFYEIFKKKIGMTPVEFRKSNNSYCNKI